MKFLTFNGFLRISILALGLLFSAGSINAATDVNTRTPTTMDRDSYTTRTTTEREDHTDWGWIGLLGLLGLTGLMQKKRTIDNDRIDTSNRNPPR